MLPKAHEFLLEGGLPPSRAAYALIGTFLAGVGGLQLVSEMLHLFLPSSIVNCDEHAGTKGGESGVHSHSHPHARPNHSHATVPKRSHEDAIENGHGNHHHYHAPRAVSDATPLLTSYDPLQAPRRPSIKQKLTGTVTAVSTLVKKRCNGDGTCYGFSDHVCEQKCDPAKILELFHETSEDSDAVAEGEGNEGEGANIDPNYGSFDGPSNLPALNPSKPSKPFTHTRRHHIRTSTDGHHHVAKNKFLSIGVQTSIAIALHKIPEGFITYATNHANPELGFAVFLAIFIHNIAEGFIMSLPLFLALKSRMWAIVWASLLGGLSQPLGAGIAAITVGGDVGSGGVGYGFLFAATGMLTPFGVMGKFSKIFLLTFSVAGIMCSVGLQLFTQAVQLHHGSKIPFVFGFIGMALLGLSFALTAK